MKTLLLIIAILASIIAVDAIADTLRLYGGYSKHLVSENVKNESHDSPERSWNGGEQ